MLAAGSPLAACGDGSDADAIEGEASAGGDGGTPSKGGDDGTPNAGDGGPPATDGGSSTPRFVDECETSAKAAVCTPLPAGFGDGDGLVPVDRCAHPLEERGFFGAPSPIVTALETIATRVSVLDLVTDANRTATATTTIPGSPANVKIGFRWQTDDMNSEAWIPQGISGSADADPTGLVAGKRIVLVSFYDSAPDGAAERGVRIAFVDITNPGAPKYRFALLVVPEGTAAAPSFGIASVHAGGIAWVGDYLYVADTTHGFRVFDMRHILKVDEKVAAIGCTATSCGAATYQYVIPQVGNYEVVSACEPLFSFVAVDRTSDPPALVSGEYCSGSACSSPFAGRILRWPLDRATGQLRSAKTYPTEAFYMGRTQVQGGVSSNGTFYLSSSQPAASGGILFRTNAQKKNGSSSWSDSPEDLMVDGKNELLWSLSELAGARTVYGVDMSKFPSL